jgi:hypothetical protein
MRSLFSQHSFPKEKADTLQPAITLVKYRHPFLSLGAESNLRARLDAGIVRGVDVDGEDGGIFGDAHNKC